MFKRKNFIEIGNEYVNEYCIGRGAKLNASRRNLNNIMKVRNFKSVRELKDYRSRDEGDIYLIYTGSEIFIKYIEIPNVRFSVLNEMVDNELIHLFEHTEELAYSYEVLVRRKNSIGVLIYCINNDENNMLLDYGFSVKGIYLIQICIWSLIQYRVKAMNMIAIIFYKSDLYMISSIEKKIIGSTLVRAYDGNKEEFYQSFQYVLNMYYKMEKYLSVKNELKIYFINFTWQDIFEDMAGIYSCENQDEIVMEDIIINLL